MTIIEINKATFLFQLNFYRLYNKGIAEQSAMVAYQYHLHKMGFAMSAEMCLKKMLNHGGRKNAEIRIGHSTVKIEVNESDKLLLKSTVYEGGNFIPSSVRKCILGKLPFSSWLLNTHLMIDEENFMISLNYSDSVRELDRQNLRELLEEFGMQADEWRVVLDEHDKHDLLPIYMKS